MTTDAPEFDVNDPARFERDRVTRIFRRTDRLVQTNRRLNLTLQHRVIEDVVVCQWLLQHHQIELIELLKERRVGEFVSGVGIAHQTDVGKLFAHAFDDLEVPTGFDLDLDALVTGVDFLTNLCKQLVGRILNANRNAGRDLRSSAAEMFPQRHARVLCFEIPARSLERRFRHAMPTHRVHQFECMSRALKLFAQHHRPEKLRQRRPRSFRPFIAIERLLTRRTLTPPFPTVRISDTRQNDAPFSGPTKTCFEKMYERQANLAQFNRLDKQSKKRSLRDTHYAWRDSELTTDEAL